MVIRYSRLVFLLLLVSGCGVYKSAFSSNNDVFCQIIAGNAPSTMYGQNDQVVIIQSRSGRPLSIPKKHIENLKALTESDVPELAETICFATQIMTRHRDFAGRLYNQAYFHTGPRAGQTVSHVHMHMAFNRSGKNPLRGNEKVVEETNLVRIVQEDDYTLRAVSKIKLPHLSQLDENSSTLLARILLTASQVINKSFPSKHYVTTIDDAGNRGLDITFYLR